MAVTALSMLCSAASAYDSTLKYGDLMGSYVSPDKNSPAAHGYGLHLIYGSPITKQFSIEFNGFGQSLSARDGFTGTASAFGAGVDLRGMFYETPRYNLFGVGGLGLGFMDQGTSGKKAVAPYLDAGIGVLVPIMHNIDFRAEGRYYGFVSSRIINGQSFVSEGRLNAGIHYRFGDTLVEQAPVVAPPPPVEVKVVDLDSDGDGVFDKQDSCPDTIPGTSVDETGCAPAVQEVAPVVSDSDGDEVPDTADKCPATAPGMKVDDTGCVIKQTLVLRNINFNTGSGELTEASKGILDKIAEGMQGQQDMTIQIDGHTDAVGAQQYNLKLSQVRAEQVRLYLIEKGVKPERMSADGFGEFKPAADNKTEEGRAQNRRVEFKITRP